MCSWWTRSWRLSYSISWRESSVKRSPRIQCLVSRRHDEWWNAGLARVQCASPASLKACSLYLSPISNMKPRHPAQRIQHQPRQKVFASAIKNYAAQTTLVQQFQQLIEVKRQKIIVQLYHSLTTLEPRSTGVSREN